MLQLKILPLTFNAGLSNELHLVIKTETGRHIFNIFSIEREIPFVSIFFDCTFVHFEIELFLFPTFLFGCLSDPRENIPLVFTIFNRIYTKIVSKNVKCLRITYRWK